MLQRICMAQIAVGLSMDAKFAATTELAAKFHDLGKADPRFQAMLIGKPLSVVYMQPDLWAKSDPTVQRPRAELPFRHEILSPALLESLLRLADWKASASSYRID